MAEGLDLADVVTDAADVGSIVDVAGTEFLADVAGTEFGVPIDGLGDFGINEIAGDFAGDADWFDTFYESEVLAGPEDLTTDPFEAARQAAEETFELKAPDEFDVLNEMSIAEQLKAIQLPTLEDLKKIPAQLSTEFKNFSQGIQQATQVFQKYAPVVNAVSSALGFQLPTGQVGQILGTANAVSGAVTGFSGFANTLSTGSTTGINRGLVTNLTAPGQVAIANYDAAVETQKALSAGAANIQGEIDQSRANISQQQDDIVYYQQKLDDPNITDEQRAFYEEAIATSEANIAYDQDSIAAKEELLINTKVELAKAEQVIATTNITALRQANPVSPTATGTTAVGGYDAAIQTRDQLTPVIKTLESDIIASRDNISQEQDNIAFLEQQKENPNLSPEEIQDIDAQIAAAEARIAEEQASIDAKEILIINTGEEIAKAEQVITTTNNAAVKQAVALAFNALGAPVPYSLFQNPNGTYNVINTTTGATTNANITLQEAIRLASAFGVVNPAIAGVATALAVNPATSGVVTPQGSTLDQLALALDPGTSTGLTAFNLVQQARDQQAARAGRNTTAQSTDWRVKLQLAPNSTYLYNSTNPGLLAPLASSTGTDGVIFPYTPAIDTAYKANYDSYDLTHSNYRGYFYKNSYVDVINIRAQFTAQDTKEANYLLAVIHFFRSATKMFYGQDTQRGAPPPLVFLTGYGDYQFNNHPCLISQFNYQLPADVDYIRAQSSLQVNTNLIANRIRNPVANNPLSYITNRLLNSNLLPGALDFRPTIGNLPMTGPTYVPTKMEISISLLPIQSRSNVSNNFSVREFAAGNLLRGGFW